MAAKSLPWEERTKRFLKAELARADVGYRELAERLKKHGLQETEASIANKISRGTFPATFLLASLKAIGREQVVCKTSKRFLNANAKLAQKRNTSREKS